MRLVSANVNGIRAAARRGGIDWLAAQDLGEVRARGRAAAAAVRADYAWSRCADALDRALSACVAGDGGATEPAGVA